MIQFVSNMLVLRITWSQINRPQNHFTLSFTWITKLNRKFSFSLDLLQMTCIINCYDGAWFVEDVR